MTAPKNLHGNHYLATLVQFAIAELRALTDTNRQLAERIAELETA